MSDKVNIQWKLISSGKTDEVNSSKLEIKWLCVRRKNLNIVDESVLTEIMPSNSTPTEFKLVLISNDQNLKDLDILSVAYTGAGGTTYQTQFFRPSTGVVDGNIAFLVQRLLADNYIPYGDVIAPLFHPCLHRLQKWPDQDEIGRIVWRSLGGS